jgi:hypothetical protein
MHRYIPLLLLMTCHLVGAQEPAAPPLVLVLDAGGHTVTIYKVPFITDGKVLISVARDTTVQFWDVASGEIIR